MAASARRQRAFCTRAAVFRRARAPVVSLFFARFQLKCRRTFSGCAATPALVRSEATRQAVFAAAADPFLVRPLIRVRPFRIIRLTHGAPVEKPKTRMR